MAHRYLGNKTRLLGDILRVVDRVLAPGATVADLMCGTASVSASLANAGYSVIASDELTFPVLHGRARLMDREPRFGAVGGYEEALRRLNALPPSEGFFVREYSDGGDPANGRRPRRYFTAYNAGRIDAMRAAIASWRRDGVLRDAEADLLLHDLLLAVNRVANIAGTYGYYRSKWNAAALMPIELRRSDFSATPGEHQVLQGRVEEVVGEVQADAIYLDPPYTKRQYAGNYHILETIAREDVPEPVGQGGLRDWYGQYSNFCSRRRVRDAFRSVLSCLGSPLVLLSYSEDGLIPPSEFAELLGEFGDVHRHDFSVARFTSNVRGRAPVLEHLYELRPEGVPCTTKHSVPPQSETLSDKAA